MINNLHGKDARSIESARRYLLMRNKKIRDTKNLVLSFFENKSPDQVRRELGTALGGIVGMNGKLAVLASDGQTSAGYNKYSMNTNKIYQVDKYTAVAGTGSVSFIQEIVKIFEVDLYFYQARQQGQFLSPTGKANLLSGLVNQIIYFGFGVGFLMAVYDPKDEEARIFQIFADGAITKDKPVLADGSGGDWVLGALDDHYEEFGGIAMTRKYMVYLTKKAIGSAIKHDLYCGGKKTIYLIDKYGARRTR